MTELTDRAASGGALTAEESAELSILAEKYHKFLQLGEQRLREGRAPSDAAAADHSLLSNIVTTTSNVAINVGKGAFFWGTLVATAVPGYLGKQLGVTKGFDHWNWLSDKLILGALPVVTKVGTSGNHLEKLKEQAAARHVKIGLVVAALQEEEMQGYGVGVLHFATKDQWVKHLGVTEYEHVPMPDMGAQVTYDAVAHAIDRMHQTMHEKKEAVYVHCKAGKGRSWMVVMCYLLTYGGMDYHTAKTTVESGRHQVNPGVSQIQFAQDFARRWNSNRLQQQPASTTSSNGVPSAS